MAAAVGVRGRCELPPCSGPGWLLSLSALLSVAARGAFATTHWVVTEDGKIQQQVAARATLCARLRPGGIPQPGPWLSSSARPRPQPPFPGPGRRVPALWALGPGAALSPLVCRPSLSHLEVLSFPPLRAAWGESPNPGRRTLGTIACAGALEVIHSLSLTLVPLGPTRHQPSARK